MLPGASIRPARPTFARASRATRRPFSAIAYRWAARPGGVRVTARGRPPPKPLRRGRDSARVWPGQLLRQALNDEGSELADLIACREPILLSRIVAPRLHLLLAVEPVDSETIRRRGA